MITAEEVKDQKFNQHIHGHGDKGMYMYGYTCVSYPRLTVIVTRKDRKSSEVSALFVDGKELPDYEAVAQALNSKHDVKGIADRLKERLFSATPFEVVLLYADGDTSQDDKLKLVVTGYHRDLSKRFPSFEGIPIQWVQS